MYFINSVHQPLRLVVNMKRFRSIGLVLTIILFLVFLNTGFCFNNSLKDESQIDLSSSNHEKNNWISLRGIDIIAENNISGSGQSRQINYSSLVQDNFKGFHSGQQLVINTGEWGLADINISMNNIVAYNSTMGENDLVNIVNLFRPSENRYYLMPFTIPYAYCYLTNITIFLGIKKLQNGNDLTLSLWNAKNVLGKPNPNSPFFTQDYDLGNSGAVTTGWVDLSLSQLLTNVSTTFSTFYISLQETAPNVDIQWYGMADSSDLEGDEFNVFYWDGTWHSNQDLDLTLITENYFSPMPSHIDLKINGTKIKDISLGKGYLNFQYEPPLSGGVIYKFQASQTFSLDLNYEEGLKKISTADTYFFAKSSWAHTTWNSSASIQYPNGSSEQTICWSLPNWNVEKVQKDAVPIDSGDWTVTSLNGQIVVTIHNASSGNWLILCNSTNFISNVDVWHAGTIVSTVNGTALVTTSANFSQNLASGYANLTIFPATAAHFNDSKQLVTRSTSVQFQSWNISETASANPGTFTIQVAWINGTEVGINSTILTVLDIPTNLTHITHTTFRLSGQSVFVYVTYTNYFTAEAIPNAQVIVKNSSSDTEWPNPYLITRYFPNGTYEIEVITLGLNPGTHYLSINMSKPFYLSSELAYINFT
ncbi:MAG: hypothetical protein ACTSQQ_15935, partial [Candidatus Helarchaeota archaeon]